MRRVIDTVQCRGPDRALPDIPPLSRGVRSNGLFLMPANSSIMQQLYTCEKSGSLFTNKSCRLLCLLSQGAKCSCIGACVYQLTSGRSCLTRQVIRSYVNLASELLQLAHAAMSSRHHPDS